MGSFFVHRPCATMSVMQWAEKQKGFTIVELLIVVVVIAILATITIVSYNGITNQAKNASVASDIKNFAKIIEMQRSSGDSGTYPFPLTKAMGIRLSQSAYMVRNNMYYCVNTTTNEFAIGAISAANRGYSYSSIAGSREYADGNASISGGNVCGLVGLSWSTSYGAYALDATTGWNTTWLN